MIHSEVGGGKRDGEGGEKGEGRGEGGRKGKRSVVLVCVVENVNEAIHTLSLGPLLLLLLAGRGCCGCLCETSANATLFQQAAMITMMVVWMCKRPVRLAGCRRRQIDILRGARQANALDRDWLDKIRFASV